MASIASRAELAVRGGQPAQTTETTTASTGGATLAGQWTPHSEAVVSLEVCMYSLRWSARFKVFDRGIPST